MRFAWLSLLIGRKILPSDATWQRNGRARFALAAGAGEGAKTSENRRSSSLGLERFRTAIAKRPPGRTSPNAGGRASLLSLAALAKSPAQAPANKTQILDSQRLRTSFQISPFFGRYSDDIIRISSRPQWQVCTRSIRFSKSGVFGLCTHKPKKFLFARSTAG